MARSIHLRARALSLALCIFDIALPLHTQTPSNLDAHSLAAKVDARYNHLHSLSAAFSEHYTGLGMDRTESGTLLLLKPGRMRWTYDSPSGKLFLLDGRFAWSYTRGDTQAYRCPAKRLDDLRSPLRLLLGHTQLTRELDHLTIAPAPGGLFTLTGTPPSQIRIRSVSLTVTPDGQIQALRIEESAGSVTTFTFTSIREDLPTTPAEFTFTPPPGVELADAPPPL